MGYADILRQTLHARREAPVRPHGVADLSRPVELGTVVLVRSMAEIESLGVILAVQTAAEGRWLFLGPGEARWVRQALIVEWAPSCPVCQQRAWCWLGMTEVRCGTCQPVRDSEWRHAWHLLAELTDGLAPDDPCLQALEAALDDGDRATKDRDWTSLQEAAIHVYWLVECHAREH